MELLTARPTRKIARRIIDAAIEGAGPLDSASELTAAALLKSGGNQYEAARRLIRSQTTLGFGGGFATGIGGFATLLFTVPSALALGWMIQARLSAAIAVLFEHDLQDERVREKILRTLIDEPQTHISEEQIEADVKEKFGLRVLKQLPSTALNSLGGLLKKQLVSRSVNTGVKLAAPRMLPIVGGALSGRIDARATRAAGERALAVFGPVA